MIMIAMLTAAALAVPQPARANETKPLKILILLDVSGSMNERISSGGTKFAAVKRSLRQVADDLPPGTEVGSRVYGFTIAEPKSKNPKTCTDTQLVMPVGPLDRAKMYRAVRSFDAKGETPIVYSLEQSVKDLGSSGSSRGSDL
jgi:Ca-activated chloride channel family protein